MNAKLRGISPLVAVIMLIAFALVLAGILSIWLQGFATERTRTLTTCIDAGFLIQSGVYIDDPQVANNTLRLTIYNYGSVPLNFTTILKYAVDNFTLNNTPLDTLPRSSTLFTIPNVSSNLQEITIRSVECEGLQDYLTRNDINGLPI